MNSEHKSICIVDDEQELLSVYVSSLRSRYQVTSFGSAQEALDSFDRGLSVDLLISDLRMPKMDGLAFIEELRGRNFASKIIVASGNAEKSDVVKALRLGVTDYLEKPFSLTELTQIVGQTLLSNDHYQLRPIEASSAWLMNEVAELNTNHFNRIRLAENQLFRLHPRGFTDPEETEEFLKLSRNGRLAFDKFDQAKKQFLTDLAELQKKAVS